jgi:hypothetical protein
VPESIRMIEPGTGEVLEIPASLTDFHNAELVQYRDAALAATFFQQWADANPASLPIRPDRCVGYRQPLFLGGTDDLDNLDETDLWVYWDICTELIARTRGLPPGTSISTTRIG